MILVGATDRSGRLCAFSQDADYVCVWAPGAGWGISAPRALKNGNAVLQYQVDEVTGDEKRNRAGQPVMFQGTSYGEQIHGRPGGSSNTFG